MVFQKIIVVQEKLIEILIWKVVQPHVQECKLAIKPCRKKKEKQRFNTY